MENNEYNSLLERVQSIITGKGYKIESNLLGEEYTFNIKDNDVIASNIRIYKTDGNIITGKTRTRQELEEPNIFKITWIDTTEEYRGQGLALLLLIYGICYLKDAFPDVSYVTLDDDSDRSDKLESNIYGSLGFEFQGLISLDITKRNRLNLSGPEKQLLLDENFIRKANAKLDSIATKKRLRDDEQQPNEQLSDEQRRFVKVRRGGKTKKTRKTRRHRMNKTNKKNKKNKKTKRRKSN